MVNSSRASRGKSRMLPLTKNLSRSSFHGKDGRKRRWLFLGREAHLMDRRLGADGPRIRVQFQSAEEGLA